MAALFSRVVLCAVLSVALAACTGEAFYPDGVGPAGQNPSDGTPISPGGKDGELPPGANPGIGPNGQPLCGTGQPLRVHFFDVGQGLSALVELPDGRTVLVDTGDSPTRFGCGDSCSDRHQHLMARLAERLQGRPLSLLWVTHQHSDHLGGAPAILEQFDVQRLVDNGREVTTAQVMRVHQAALARGTTYDVVAPGRADAKFPGDDSLQVRAIVPSSWGAACDANENDCSIGLRLDYCDSSVLFTGDLESTGEGTLDISGPVSLLQVGHHGSDTSTSEAFIRTLSPKYAVISSAQVGIGLNKTYCHPRLSTVERLNAALGDVGMRRLRAYGSAAGCQMSSPEDWIEDEVSDRLFATPLDGDVTLTTYGDGRFVRERL